MSYVDGYVVPVPLEKKEEYLKQSRSLIPVYKEYGVLEIYENWGDDVPEGKLTSFQKAVQCQEGEVVVFSWMVWPSKEARDEGWKRLYDDPRMQPGDVPMPFDGKRLIYGGFETVIHE